MKHLELGEVRNITVPLLLHHSIFTGSSSKNLPLMDKTDQDLLKGVVLERRKRRTLHCWCIGAEKKKKKRKKKSHTSVLVLMVLLR